MKRAIVVWLIFFCSHWMNAQTPCERMFTKAMNYCEAGDYPNAKSQFQKVVENCDSNKEIAKVCIKLCETCIGLTAEQQKEKKSTDTCSQIIKRLNDRISQLEEEKNNYVCQIKTATKYLKEMKSKDSLLIEENKQLQESLSFTEEQIPSLIESLRSLGNDLNNCLESYWVVRIRMGEPLENYDTINDANGLIEAMSRNIKLASREKKNN